MGGVPLPPLNFTGGTAKSGADAGGGTAASGPATFDNSGFTVNYAPSLGVGGGSMPSWVWIAAALVAVVWLKNR